MSSEPSSFETRLQETIAAYLQETAAGRTPDRDEWLARHPELADELRAFFADHDAMTQAAAPVRDKLDDSGQAAASADLSSSADASPDGSAGTEKPTTPTAEAFPQSFGDYELLEEIGKGGMGVVYKARQVSLNRIVALKRIRAGQLASSEDIARFQHEAKAAAGLDHPHIVPIYEVGEHQGQHYFTMKFIEGGNLTAHLDRVHADPKAAARLLAQVSRALHHAHQRGILHRDIKPSNTLIDAEGRAHVSDFGLAKQIEDDGKLTRSGAIVGTPEFMAPEQARGEKGLTIAVDIYGVGAVLYFLLTRQSPFQGDYDWEILKQLVEDYPRTPRSIHPQANRDLETVCLKCLHKDPARRYSSAEELAQDVERCQRGERPLARPASRRERLRQWVRKHPTRAAVLVVLFLATAALLASGLFFNWRLRGEIDAVSKARDELKNAGQALADERATGKEKLATGKAKLDAAIAETDEEKKKASRVLVDFGRATMVLQMSRAQAIREADPLTASKLLHDYERCPIDLRKTDWHLSNNTIPTGPTILSLPENNLGVLGVHPDGTLIATGRQNTVELHEFPLGRFKLALKGHKDDEVTCVAFSADGSQLALGGKDGLVTVWETSSGKQLYTLKDHSRPIERVAFTHDRKHVVGLHAPLEHVMNPLKDRAVLWEIPSGRKVQSFSCQTIAVNPTAQELVVTSDWGSGFHEPSGKPEEPYSWRRDLETLLKSVAYSLDGKKLYGSTWEDFKVLDVSTGKAIFKLDSNPAETCCSLLNADGSMAIFGTRDGKLHWVDLSSPREPFTMEAHRGEILALALTHGGDTLVTAGKDGVVKFWKLTPSLHLATFAPETIDAWPWRKDEPPQFSPDGRWVIWKKQVRELDHWSKGPLPIAPAVWKHFSSDSRWLLACGSAHGLPLDHPVATLWDLRTRTKAFELTRQEAAAMFNPVGAPADAGGRAAFTTDSRYVFLSVSSGRREVRKLISLDGKVTRELSIISDFPPRVLAGGKRLAISGWDTKWGAAPPTFRDQPGDRFATEVVDAATGDPLFTAPGTYTHFGPNGTTMIELVGDPNHKRPTWWHFRFWSEKTGICKTTTFPGFAGVGDGGKEIRSQYLLPPLLPDGESFNFVVESAERGVGGGLTRLKRRIEQWNCHTGKTKTLIGDDTDLSRCHPSCCLVSPSGALLAIGDYGPFGVKSAPIRVYDAMSGKLKSTVDLDSRGLLRPLRPLAFGAEEKTLLVGVNPQPDDSNIRWGGIAPSVAIGLRPAKVGAFLAVTLLDLEKEPPVPVTIPKGKLLTSLLHRDGRTLVLIDEATLSTITLWDRIGGKEEKGKELASLVHPALVSHVGVTTDGSRLITETSDGRVWVWDIPVSRLTPKGVK